MKESFYRDLVIVSTALMWAVKTRRLVAQNRIYLCLMHKSCRGGEGQGSGSSRSRCLGKRKARYISLNAADRRLAFPSSGYRQKGSIWIFITTPRWTFNPCTINQIHVESFSICFVSKCRLWLYVFLFLLFPFLKSLLLKNRCFINLGYKFVLKYENEIVMCANV